MRLIAKAALGALALASLGFGAGAPANAQSVVVTRPVITSPRIVSNACLRPPAFRPAFCFNRGRMAYLGPSSWARRHMIRQHLRRQAMLYRNGFYR